MKIIDKSLINNLLFALSTEHPNSNLLCGLKIPIFKDYYYETVDKLSLNQSYSTHADKLVVTNCLFYRHIAKNAYSEIEFPLMNVAIFVKIFNVIDLLGKANSPISW